jgi:exopolysaccharide biosynthesis polyprenyl glycosylphosphotransferase
MNAYSLSSKHHIELIGAKSFKAGRGIHIPDYHFGAVGWLLVDSGTAFLAALAACWLSFAYQALRGAIVTDERFSVLITAAVYALLFAIFAHVFGLHDPLMRRDRLILAAKSVCVVALSVTGLALFELMIFYTRVGRHILLNTFVLSSTGMVVLRLALWRLSEGEKRRVVVVGSAELADRVLGLVKESNIPYEVVPLENVRCVLQPDGANGELPMACLHGSNASCRKCDIHEIVACYTEQTPRHELAALAHLLLSGVQVSDHSTFIERTFFKVPVQHIGPQWFFQCNTSPDDALYRGAKRLVDIFVGVIGLIATAPVLLLASLLIRLEGGGPVFYSQVRVGQFGRPFQIWKLRSMRVDAEKEGPQWAQEQDERVTRVGRFLRLTRLDEVPQFYNVVRGDMSLIGPRPERWEFVETLAKDLPFYHQRHLVRPGITGWAQINYPYGATREDALGKLEYDLYYIKYASLILDIQIVLRTIGALMKGAR